MYILGLNLYHDTSAALIKDGKIIGAIEEERITRQKHISEFPKNSIEWLLKKENITIDEVDHVVTSFELEKFKGNVNTWGFNTNFHDELTTIGSEKIAIDNEIVYLKLKRDMNKNGFEQWESVPHHFAHAAGAYYLSGFNETNILVIDGRGEDKSTSLMYGKDGNIKIIDQYPIKDSLGQLYTYVTYLCGLYTYIGQEGKTMGLAPYGKENYELKEIFEKIIKVDGDDFSIDRDEMRKLKKYACKKFTMNEISADLAFHVQKSYEKALKILAKKIYNITKCTNFVCAGGVTLNCEGNRILLEQDFVENLYVQPAANDAGTCIGAALYWYSKLNNLKPSKTEDVYLGLEYSDDEIEKVLNNFKVKYKKVENAPQVAANLLAEGKVIAWFQSKMEFGPRALGNRSILANPCIANMNNIVNIQVKDRENWRPFAPSLLFNHMHEYFDTVYEAPNMTISFVVKESMREKIPAVVHIDGTTRIQTVTKERNEKYHDLISYFYELTNVPFVLNTSFNDKREPIVCSPADAIRTFFGTALDALVIGDFLLEKSAI